MADSDSHIVICRDKYTREKLLNLLFASDIVVHDFKGGKIRFYAMTEGTVSVANTGAATDTVCVKDSASLFSFVRSALFNSTLQNENKESQALVGFALLVDHTKTSPDTDDGSIEFIMDYRHRTGGAPTYAKAGYGRLDIQLESHSVVEAAGLGDLPYAGPFILALSSPIIVLRNQSITEYISCFTTLWRTTTDRPTFTAHTVITTYTLKVAGYAVLVDLEVLGQYFSIADFWNDFMKGD
jgi:hypothetical protein